MQYYFYTLSADSDPNNIRYVGVTTKLLKQRMYGHRYNATKNEKRTQPVHKWMWSVIEKGDAVSIHFLDECDETLWEDREKYWIKYHKDLGYKLLNVQEGGAGVVTKEMRKKDGIQRSADAHKKAICQIDPKTHQLIAVYDSIRSATKAMGLNSHSAIGNALSKTNDTVLSAGYYWVYKTDYDNGTFKLKEIDPFSHVSTPMVYRFDLEGNLINSYHGVSYTVYALGLNTANTQALHLAIKEKKVYHNSYWSWDSTININEFIPYYKYQEIDDDGNIIEQYTTYKSIAQKYKMGTSLVQKRVRDGKLFGKNKIIKIKI